MLNNINLNLRNKIIYQKYVSHNYMININYMD